MTADLYVPRGRGRTFQFATETITFQASMHETADKRALLYWVAGPSAEAPPHTHEQMEETFYIIDGALQFTLGTDTLQLQSGDFVRVPPNARHGYINRSDRPVPMLVTLSPGDLAELFYEYRSGPGGKEVFGHLDRYLADARRRHGTVYELPGR